MLSRMMLSGANVVLLDQPTNHLDMESIQRVNKGLEAFPGVVLLPHDHELLTSTFQLGHRLPSPTAPSSTSTALTTITFAWMASASSRKISFRNMKDMEKIDIITENGACLC